jgi:hypothetical protein
MHHPCRTSTSLEARLGNPLLTCFQVKQATKSRRVSHTVFILPLDFDAQTMKPSRSFCGPNHQTAATGSEAQTEKPVDLGFEAEPKNPCSLSLSAWCRPHTTLPDLLIVRLPSTRPVLDHPRSSTPSLLLLPRFSSLPAVPHLSPTRHETSKHVYPHNTDNGVEPPKFPGFKFIPRQVNYSSRIKPRY